MKEQFDRDKIIRHPCFSEEAHGKYGRLHLPVAPKCNISCNYCDRKFDCVNEARPGVSSRVLTPNEAFERVLVALDRQKISVVGVAGPGEPLANSSTFEFFNLIRKEISDTLLCLSTNGLELTNKVEILKEFQVFSVTVTINALRVSTAEKIYSWASYNGKLMKGEEAAKAIIENQWKGLEILKKENFYVKVNSVLIPGINCEEIELIAKKAKNIGIDAMNIIPLIPQGRFRDMKRPTCEELENLRLRCMEYLPQIKHCRQCRADAFGNLDDDRDMEIEMIYNALSYDYCETV